MEDFGEAGGPRAVAVAELALPRTGPSRRRATKARRECVRHGGVGGDGRWRPLHGAGSARCRRESDSTTATGSQSVAPQSTTAMGAGSGAAPESRTVTPNGVGPMLDV